MKRNSLTAVTMAFAIGMMTVNATAQDTTNPVRDKTRGPNAGKLDEKTSGANIRVSQLIGMNIQNDQGESVGEINDLVIDSSSGKVRYAAVTYGGIIGIGNKLFAVPFEAFQVQPDPDDPDDLDDYVLVLNVTQKQLEGAQGFDEDHWPNMADKNFVRELNQRYGVERNRKNRNRLRGVDVDVNRNGVDIDVEREKK
ncbi:PRC-barrel domain protein [Novipirellula galeiformis]|uniref:PRC-barrel domain protein n=1 Tax=Novipirellula galeiformis TaxID=2528004 RepID=A0A5C6CHW0_9BACT|nr:PRC-barrel domain-containing protein [Novipirellula galeiformis]TWU22329.1 PRC-barrel domain protein [Novipirellula galeiformis]